ncbi:MAG TPA: hypothetical protein VK832_19740 [Burkholderiaceae bacterium]|jgi:hypothetical protein|nr:hypothetical protein [Burkholderiaceae bacterium]
MKNVPNRLIAPLKRIGLIGALLVTSSVAAPAFAGLSVGIEVGVPPPPLRVETVPVAPVGYVWAPGFWEFFHGQYVWRRGHFVAGRPGYRWVPENWERRGEVHHFNEGHWDRDPNFHGDHRR